MASFGNTFGVLIPKPAAPAMVSQGSANPPEPLTNAAGPVDVIEMVADVASTALSIVAPILSQPMRLMPYQNWFPLRP